MKHYPNHEAVCAAFAARRPNGTASHIWFDGDTIYSYGTHFPVAKIIAPKVALFTSKSRSKSTAKHKCRVHSALISNGYRVIVVDDPLGSFENNYVEGVKHIASLLDKAKRATKISESRHEPSIHH